MEQEHVYLSNDHEKKSSEIKPLVERKQDECSSPSSSSSRSSIEFGAAEKGNLETSSPEFKFDATSFPSPEYGSSPDVTSDHTSQPSTGSMWEMKSPPLQTIGQPADYDPNRIPSSIFSSKPANTFEWSAASNESLFSIHMGNNSFSRDYGVLFGKSGELPPWAEEYNDTTSSPNLASEAKGSELNSLPPVMEVSTHEENDGKFDHKSKLQQEHHDNSPKAASGASAENQRVAKMGSAEDVNFTSPTCSASPPRLSNESGNSGKSFAFPVLVSEAGKSRSLNVATEKAEQPLVESPTQSHVPETATPKAAPQSKWFSCISGCPRWCC